MSEIGQGGIAAPSDVEHLGNVLRQQGFDTTIGGERVGSAATRDDLGLTSLQVIMVVANYMESVGASVDDFDPAWVSALEDVAGIVWVLRQVDDRARARLAV